MRRHRREALPPAPAQQLQQHGLGLIVGMRAQQARYAMLARRSSSAANGRRAPPLPKLDRRACTTSTTHSTPRRSAKAQTRCNARAHASAFGLQAVMNMQACDDARARARTAASSSTVESRSPPLEGDRDERIGRGKAATQRRAHRLEHEAAGREVSGEYEQDVMALMYEGAEEAPA